ncbi:MAG: hypothetical protein O2782_15935 [bacterium]|nr:hypothetical protein [bacterium]
MRMITAAATALAVGAVTLAGPAAARDVRPAPAAKVAQEARAFGQRSLMNINNMSLWFQRDGNSANNPANGNSGVTFPKSTDQVIYQDGVIWGGIVNDGDPQTLRVGGQTYAVGTVPGAIISKGVAENPDDPSVRIYRIRRDYAQGDLRRDASELFNIGLQEVTEADLAALRAQYEKNWREWPADKGAPFYDNDGDGVYTPAFDAAGNPVLDGSADEPGVAQASMVAWFVVNDLDVGAATGLYGSKPIGLEVQITIWGYDRADELGDAIFKKYQVVYEGTANTPDDAVINDMYFAQWSDPDLGDYGDDFAGSDVDLSLGYVYNGQQDDSHYTAFNLAPPAAGYDFLQGPVVPVYLKDDNGDDAVDDDGNAILDTSAEAIFNFGRRPGYKNLPMTSYVYFAAGSAIGDPELGEYVGTEEWYNLLRGYQPQPDINSPVPYVNPLTGEETKFTLDGDPTRATGWNDGTPLPAGDRRIVLNTGPFTMALGDTQEVVVALLGAVSTDRLRSVAKLKFTDQFVQDAYNNFFQVASPPAAPNVNVVQLSNSIVLDWGWNRDAIEQTETVGSAGFAFEGYNVYQLPTPESSVDQGILIGTFDLVNGITTILGISLDEDSGIILDVPQQIGIDVGVKRNLKLTADAVRGGPLVNGQEYYFAVTAYNRAESEGAAITTLESSAQLLIVKPQDPPPGTRYGTTPFESLVTSHQGASEGGVEVTVINPTMTTGNSYEVTFGADDEGSTVWSLRDATTGTTILSGQTEVGPSDARVPIYVSDHGFEIMVLGPPLALSNWEWEGPERWISGVDWGGSGLFGGAGVGPNFFGSALTGADLKTIELRFSPTVGQKGYRYLRGGDPNYGYQDFADVPFTAWEVDSNPPRQVNVLFTENAGSSSENGRWDLASDEADRSVGGREYIFVMDSDYSDTPLARYTSINVAGDAETLDTHVAIWPLLRGTREMDLLAEGQILRLTPFRVNTANDMFSFVAPGSEVSDAYLKQDLAKVNAFPNPYYGVNSAETSRYSHFVTFSHLPSRVKVRIFDASGTLV